MFNLKLFQRPAGLAIVAAAGALCGIAATVIAADAVGVGIHAYSGEDAATRAREKAFPVTAYEDESKVGGGGAPEKTLVDNDSLRVHLVEYKKGYIRPGSVRRRNDQLLVYIDEGQYTTLKAGDGRPLPNPRPSHEPPGSSVFHWADTVVTENRIDNDYRVLYIEVKKQK